MATDVKTEVEKLYVAYFSRPADVGGLNYWMNVLSTDPGGYQKISASFASSQEYHDTYAGMDNTAIVNAVYQHLFGRSAETTGLNYWANLLNQKQITIDNVVTQVAAGAQGSDLFTYNAKVAVAGAFTDRMDTQAEKDAYTTMAAAKIGIAYIETVKDLQTAAAGMDPGAIDTAIAQIVGSHTTGFSPVHVA
jgi:hypothetical protein